MSTLHAAWSRCCRSDFGVQWSHFLNGAHPRPDHCPHSRLDLTVSVTATGGAVVGFSRAGSAFFGSSVETLSCRFHRLDDVPILGPTKK